MHAGLAADDAAATVGFLRIAIVGHEKLWIVQCTIVTVFEVSVRPRLIERRRRGTSNKAPKSHEKGRE